MHLINSLLRIDPFKVQYLYFYTAYMHFSIFPKNSPTFPCWSISPDLNPVHKINTVGVQVTQRIMDWNNVTKRSAQFSKFVP